MDYEGTEMEVEIYLASEHCAEHEPALEEGEPGMSETPDIPVEQESSAIKFDLGNLKLDLEGTLERVKGDSEALRQLHDMLSDALEKCSQAMAELEG